MKYVFLEKLPRRGKYKYDFYFEYNNEKYIIYQYIKLNKK